MGPGQVAGECDTQVLECLHLFKRMAIKVERKVVKCCGSFSGDKHPLALSRIESEMVIMWPLLNSSYILPEGYQITGRGDWLIKEEVVSKEGVLSIRWSWNWSDTIDINEEKKRTQYWALRNSREHGFSWQSCGSVAINGSHCSSVLQEVGLYDCCEIWKTL